MLVRMQLFARHCSRFWDAKGAMGKSHRTGSSEIVKPMTNEMMHRQ